MVPNITSSSLSEVMSVWRPFISNSRCMVCRIVYLHAEPLCSKSGKWLKFLLNDRNVPSFFSPTKIGKIRTRPSSRSSNADSYSRSTGSVSKFAVAIVFIPTSEINKTITRLCPRKFNACVASGFPIG